MDLPKPVHDKAQHGNVHSTTLSTNKYNQKGKWHLTVKNGTQRVCFVPLFLGPTWEGSKRAFSDNSQGGYIPLDGT